MKLINPTYRLSGFEFFQYTLSYCGFIVVFGIIFLAVGGLGDWTGLLVGLAFFFLYLQYIIRPRLKDMSHSSWWVLAILIPLIILPWSPLLTPEFVIYVCIAWMILTLLFFPGNQSVGQGIRGLPIKVTVLIFIAVVFLAMFMFPILTLLFFPGNQSVGQGIRGLPIKVTVLIFIAVVFLAMFMFPLIMLCPGGLFCSGWETGDRGAKAAEREVVQTAIDVFMVDNNLVEVTPSTSGAGGEKISDTGGQFHATLDLQPYIRDFPSTYCYRWQSNGRVMLQYDVNADGNCAIDTDQLFP